MATSNKPWWYIFAQIGVAASAPIKILAGVAKLIPVVPVQLAGDAMSLAEPEVTAEAEKGVKSVS